MLDVIQTDSLTSCKMDNLTLLLSPATYVPQYNSLFYMHLLLTCHFFTNKWVGRIFANTGSCGPKGESCTITEWNMDSGDFFTPQSYDISNIQGFTQSVQVGMAGCDTVTCKDVNCGCKSAYPPGDLSGCVNDSPVHACGSGDIGMSGMSFYSRMGIMLTCPLPSVVFCP